MADRSPDLFAAQENAEREALREDALQSSWDVWGWSGPVVGEMCEIDLPCPDTVEGGRLYCYTELARLIEQRPDGLWIAEIAMPEPWAKNGRRVLLSREWVGPPRNLIRAARQVA